MSDVTGTYYPSETFIGYGAEFYVGQSDGDTGSPPGSPFETFVAVPEVMKIAPIVSMTTAVVDVTHLRSPDRHREKIPTLSDSGPIVVEGNYRPGHGAHLLAGGDGFSATNNLQALRASAALCNFRIVLPTAAGTVGSPAEAISLPLEGYVTKYEIGELSLEGKVPFVLEVTPAHAYFAR